MIYREAYEVRKKEGPSRIVTGSSRGQVASQTAANMHAQIYQFAIPIYHPLIAFDKTEIMDLARKIGMYEISNRPAGSCTAVPECRKLEQITTLSHGRKEDGYRKYGFKCFKRGKDPSILSKFNFKDLKSNKLKLEQIKLH